MQPRREVAESETKVLALIDLKKEDMFETSLMRNAALRLGIWLLLP